MKGLFDEMGVLHIVEPGVEEADLGNYGQSEEWEGDEWVDVLIHTQLMRLMFKTRNARNGIVDAKGRHQAVAWQRKLFIIYKNVTHIILLNIRKITNNYPIMQI